MLTISSHTYDSSTYGVSDFPTAAHHVAVAGAHHQADQPGRHLPADAEPERKTVSAAVAGALDKPDEPDDCSHASSHRRAAV